MSLKQYIAESEKVYAYRVRTICVMDDNAMDWFERVLLKYLPIELSKPTKTMLQKSPLDFKNVPASEVWIVDLKLALPASSYVLQKELQLALGIPENHIIVRGYNDPTEIENGRLDSELSIDLEAAAKGLTPDALLNNGEYPEAETAADPLYGDDYNKKFLGYLRTVQKEREATAKVDAPNTAFKWLDLPKSDVADDNGAFNADIEGAPKIGEPGSDLERPENIANQGNLTNRVQTYRRLYGKDGTRTVLDRTVDTTKAPK